MSRTIKGLIDISDIETFPKDLIDCIENNLQLLQNYNNEARLHRDSISSDNIYANDCISCFKTVTNILLNYSFLFVHYSRLLKDEIDNIKRDGLKILTPQLNQEKLQRLLNRNIIGASEICQIKNDTSICFSQNEATRISYGERQNMLWLTSLGFSCNNYGIINLLNNWGGENIYKFMRDSILFKHIGYPAIVLVKFSLPELTKLLGNGYLLAYQVIKSYMSCRYDLGFYWSGVCYFEGKEVCLDEILSFSLESSINANNIIDVYKLGDADFTSLISQEIINDLCEPNIT